MGHDQRQPVRFALPCEQRIFAAIREMGAVGRLHICGNTNRILPDMARSGAAIIDLDWMVDWGLAASLFGDEVAPCGNVDPVGVMLQGSPEDVRKAVLDCVRTGGKRSFIMAGCEIPDGTPDENLLALAQALQWSGGDRMTVTGRALPGSGLGG